MSNELNKVLSICIIIGVIMAGLIFFQGSMGAVDDGIDMSGSAYEDTYNTTTTISIESISMVNVLLIILAAFAIIIGAKSLTKA